MAKNIIDDAPSAPSMLGESLLRGLQQTLDYANGKTEGFRITHYAVDEIDIKAVRKKLGLTQNDFCGKFKINTETLRAWEQGKNTPPSYAIAYLKTIAVNPELVVGAIGIQVT